MTSLTLTAQDDPFAAYLRGIQTLTQEMEEAMAAIVANDLTQLQQCITRQELLAASLNALARRCTAKSFSSNSQSAQQTALHALKQASARYSVLLKHSGKTVSLLLSLCSGHTGQIKQAHSSSLKRQTWSCEA